MSVAGTGDGALRVAAFLRMSKADCYNLASAPLLPAMPKPPVRRVRTSR
jgi:hypothetical protein